MFNPRTCIIMTVSARDVALSLERGNSDRRTFSDAYWDGNSSTISHTISLLSALVTGKPGPMGEHAKLPL